MKKSTRLLIGLGVIEALLLAIGLWLMDGLASGDLQAANSPAETVRTVWTVLVGAMGVIAGICAAAFIGMRRKGL